jgi:hypothetical protein
MDDVSTARLWQGDVIVVYAEFERNEEDAYLEALLQNSPGNWRKSQWISIKKKCYLFQIQTKYLPYISQVR